MAEIGSVLGGRYRLMELLGQGGMATIYRAHDAQLDRDVAVKILRPEYGRDPDFGTRFRQEALSAASLNHPNVVAVYDFGQDEHGPFIVMELIDGEDLASIMRRNGHLAPRQAARVAAEVARALSAAHARGIVHRDVKPGNVMLSSDGRVKVADFGIARAIAEAQMTLPGTTLGSVHYFSPEQARGEQTTASSDIYALGIVLYEMLTGRRPFEGDSAAAIAMARLAARPPDMAEVRAGIPPALEAIVRRAMALDPGERFPSSAAMADALDTYLADRSLAAAGADAGSTAPAPFSGAPVAAAGALGAASLAGAMAGGAAPVAGAAPFVRAMPVAPSRAETSRIPYSDDAYAGGDDEAVPPPRGPVSGRSGRPPIDDGPFDDEGDDGSGGPWVWISGLLGLAILAVVAFLVFRLLSAPPTPTATQVVVPDFVGKTYDIATVTATQAGLVLNREFDTASTEPVNTIIKQDPGPLSLVQRGSTITVTLAAGSALVAVPDIKNLSEPQALSLITQAGLLPGTRTEAPDPVAPALSIISQDPRAGLQVGKSTTVDYVISTGPVQSASPSPSPSPTPTPTPPPTLPPTPPPPTPSPSIATPSPITVGEYRCQTLGQARADILIDGFTVGTIKPQPSTYVVQEDAFVYEQLPLPNKKRAPGTPIDLTVYDPAQPLPSPCPSAAAP